MFWAKEVKKLNIHFYNQLFSGVVIAILCLGGKLYAADKIGGNYALVISETQYSKGWPDLPTREEQISALTNQLKKYTFKVSQVANADKAFLVESIENFISAYAKNNNRLILFYTGHSYTNRQGESCLIPTDAPLPSKNIGVLMEHVVSVPVLLRSLKLRGFDNIIIAIDSSFSLHNNQIDFVDTSNSVAGGTNQEKIHYVVIGAGSDGEIERDRSQFIEVFSQALAHSETGNNGILWMKPFLQYINHEGKRNSWQMPWYKVNGTVSSLDGIVLADRSKQTYSDLPVDNEFATQRNNSGSKTSFVTPQPTTQDTLPVTKDNNLVVKDSPVGSIMKSASLVEHAIVAEKKQLTMPSVLGINWIKIPKGQFNMGGKRYNEGPILSRRIESDFYIMATELSVKQYAEYLRETVGDLSSLANTSNDMPMVNVSWQDAVDFAQWLTERYGDFRRIYRLPSEAEWEYVAKMGLAGSGNGNTLFPGKMRGAAVPVDQAWQNKLKIFGMPGNVWEWCSDCWTQRHEVDSSKGIKDCANKVIRGGSWRDSKRRVTVTSRNGIAKLTKADNIGFRLVVQE